MKNYKMNSFLAKNELDTYISISDNLSILELKVLSLLWHTYTNDILFKTFNITSMGESVKFVSRGEMHASIQTEVNEADLKEENLFLLLTVSYLNVDKPQKSENVKKWATDVLKLPKIDDSFESIKSYAEVILSRLKNPTTEQLINFDIKKDRYFSHTDDFYLGGLVSQLFLRAKDGLTADDLIEIFNTAIGKLKDSVIDTYLYSNGNDEILNDVITLFDETFVANKELNALKVTKIYNDTKEKYIVNKTTSESIRFFSFNQNQNKVSQFITFKYFKDVLSKFYLEVIRLKHNLIYSPALTFYADSAFAKHEVKKENLELICSIEDDFYNDLFTKKEVSKEIFDALILQLQNDALNGYESQNWNYFILFINDLGFEVKSDNPDDIYNQYLEIINNIKIEDIDWNLINYDAKSLIVGE